MESMYGSQASIPRAVALPFIYLSRGRDSRCETRDTAIKKQLDVLCIFFSHTAKLTHLSQGVLLYSYFKNFNTMGRKI